MSSVARWQQCSMFLHNLKQQNTLFWINDRIDTSIVSCSCAWIKSWSHRRSVKINKNPMKMKKQPKGRRFQRIPSTLKLVSSIFYEKCVLHAVQWYWPSLLTPKKIGLADEHGDIEETVEEVHEEKPLAVNTKPFVVRKFRDALRRKDCITG